jgi:hypothetical protein
LEIAVLRGNIEATRKLLADKRVQDCLNWDGVVYNACRQPNAEIVVLILDQPAARLSRKAIRAALMEKHDFIITHPKYSPAMLTRKSASDLMLCAIKHLDANNVNRAKQVLRAAVRQLKNTIDSNAQLQDDGAPLQDDGAPLQENGAPLQDDNDALEDDEYDSDDEYEISN